MEDVTSTEIRKNIAANVKILLEQKDWSASDLSRESGVPKMTISDILAEKRCPRVDVLKKIADAFFASLDQLVTIQAPAPSSRA
jgi:transcriptional regulator with XRE-family HTH domain